MFLSGCVGNESPTVEESTANDCQIIPEGEFRMYDETGFLGLISVLESKEVTEDASHFWSDYIGDCFMKIATHLSYKPNFVNYMFREDMISDGIENCVQYIENFNPEKSKNPFAYFTQIIYYAFLRRIQKEKRQLEIKNKILDKSGYEVAFHTDDKGASSDYNTIKENVQIKIK